MCGQIKNRLISCFAVSSESRLRQLLKGELSGEGKPLLILSRIRSLSQDKCSGEVIKTVFLDQLPSNCRSALALSEVTDLNKLAELADPFIEVAGQISSSTSAVSQNNSNDELSKKIDALSAKVNEMSLQNASRSNHRSGPYKKRYKSKSNGRNFNNRNNFNSRNSNNDNNYKGNKRNDSNNKDAPLCFYHSKFVNEARGCISPCIMNPRNASVN